MRAVFLMCLGCAAQRAEGVQVCCAEKARSEVGPERCAEAARASADPWHQLWECVNHGRFTALGELLSGAWDRDLQSRPDAPLLVLRVLAARGGQVDEDLARLHERRVPLFSLSQALARPKLYRGALLILRARLSSQGMLDETHLVSSADLPTGQRALAVIDDPFLERDDALLVLARFESLRDDDGWPQLSVISHLKPATQ